VLAGGALAEVRMQELRAACQLLGVSWLRCYRRADGALPWARRGALVAQLARALRETRPSAVVTFGEDGLYYHHDHVAVWSLTRAAIASLGRAAPELYEAAWPARASMALVAELQLLGLPSDLWGIAAEDFGCEEADQAIAVDVRPFSAVKLAALRCHRSQIGTQHAFSSVPPAVFARHLGWERFRAGRRRRWLEGILAHA
jgi:LmbE family N-acetylglucosaminyl deacetylase